MERNKPNSAQQVKKRHIQWPVATAEQRAAATAQLRPPYRPDADTTAATDQMRKDLSRQQMMSDYWFKKFGPTPGMPGWTPSLPPPTVEDYLGGAGNMLNEFIGITPANGAPKYAEGGGPSVDWGGPAMNYPWGDWAGKAYDTLLGPDRYKLWPERMLESAVKMPQPMDPKTGHTSDAAIAWAANAAGLAGSGTALAGKSGLGAGPMRLRPQAETVVDAFPQETATGQQWTAALTKGGVRQDEMDYRNLGQLEAPRKYTKTEIKDMLAQKPAPQVQEVVKGGGIESMSTEEYQRLLNIPETELTTEQAARIYGDNNPTNTKYHQYQLPGGENYREILLTMPSKVDADKLPSDHPYWSPAGTPTGPGGGAQDRWQNPDYITSHWDEPNVLVHARVNDRSVPGVGNALHAEELQSDWHQAGRKQGYGSKDIPVGIQGIANRIGDYRETHPRTISTADLEKATQLGRITPEEGHQLITWQEQHPNLNPVPDAPFKSTWPDLMLRHLMTKAVVEGKDALSWSDGATQADRYDLSKQVSQLAYDPKTGQLFAWGVGRNTGTPILNQIIKPEDLEKTIGKEAADRIINAPTKTGVRMSSPGSTPFTPSYTGGFYNTLNGMDLKIGGEGMQAFYDKMLPAKANKMWGKYGAKVDRVPLGINQAAQVVDAINFLSEGSSRYNREELEDMSNSQILDIARQEGWQPKDATTAHVVRITPQLKAAVQKGLPLFAGGGAIKINKNYDIPAVGGISRDGKTVYIDKDMPSKIPTRAATVDGDKAIALHEKVEQDLMKRRHDR